MNAKGKTVLLCLAVLSLIAFSPVLATATDVYLEGVYDAQYLYVYIYADFSVSQVISYGVRLNYLPAELTAVSASKTSDLPDGDPTPYTSNATMWELGTGMNKDNPAPTILADTVVLKGGIINEADPGSSGVVDLTKVFLGMVRFGPGTGGIIPTAPTLSLTYAEGDGTGPYKNFVQYVGGADPGVVLDGSINFLPVNVSTTPRDIVELGDANGDGFVNSTDYVAVRNFLTSPNPPARADANRDGLVNSTDYVAVRNKL